MNGRPSQPRRGRGRGQQRWRPQQQEGEEEWGPRTGGPEPECWEPRGGLRGGHRQDRRPQWDERPKSWGRPQHEHRRPQKDHRQLAERDEQQQQSWRQRAEHRGPEPKRDTQQPEQDVQTATVYPQGTCVGMCPKRELQEREAQCRLHRFEMLAGTERDRRPKADPARMVKEYSRPAAGKDATLPSDLRPTAVLLKTVCYLIDEIAASTTLQPWTEVYSFVFDRLRCVRQDMIIQRASGPDCVAILERTVRFLLYASYRLCGEPLQLYDPKINDTHLQESLSWLLESYCLEDENDTHTTVTVTVHASSQSQALENTHASSQSQAPENTHASSQSQAPENTHASSQSQAPENTHASSQSQAPENTHASSQSQAPENMCKQSEGTAQSQDGNQGEFEALNLLYNLGCARVMQHALELPACVRSSPAVRRALAVSRAFCERNPVRLLRLAGRLDFLQSCALHRHLPTCRRQLLLLYSHAHSSRVCHYPLAHLAALLHLGHAQAQHLCQVHGVAVTDQGWVVFNKAHFLETPTEEVRCANAHKTETETNTETNTETGPKVALIIHGHQ